MGHKLQLHLNCRLKCELRLFPALFFNYQKSQIPLLKCVITEAFFAVNHE